VGGRSSQDPRLGCVFYRTGNDREPVRDWLRDLGKEGGGGAMSKKHIGSSLSSFLDEMNIREETELLAIKKTLSHQLHQAMKRRNVSQSRLAKEMRTSRTVINRMLDPSDTGVTLATLTRASQVLGLRVQIRLSATRRPAA